MPIHKYEYRAGQKVNLKHYGPAVIIRKGAKLETFIVSMFYKNELYTWTVEYSEIEPYTDVCWKCGHDIDSTKQVTCAACHWVICSKCGACKKGGCEPDKIPMDIRLPIIENEPPTIEVRNALHEMEVDWYGR